MLLLWIPFIPKLLLDSIQSVFEVVLLNPVELLWSQVVLQKDKDQILQGAEIQEEVPDRGGPIQTFGQNRNWIHLRFSLFFESKVTILESVISSFPFGLLTTL